MANISHAVAFKKKHNLAVTIGIQMVLMPEFVDEIIPFAQLGLDLGVDYAVIKHCSDDENETLGVDYSKYASMYDSIERSRGNEHRVKQKLLSNGIKWMLMVSTHIIDFTGQLFYCKLVEVAW